MPCLPVACFSVGATVHGDELFQLLYCGCLYSPRQRMLYWFQCVCLSGTERRVIRLSTQVGTMFGGILDHLVDVRLSVCLFVRPSVMGDDTKTHAEYH